MKRFNVTNEAGTTMVWELKNGIAETVNIRKSAAGFELTYEDVKKTFNDKKVAIAYAKRILKLKQ